MSPDRHHVTQKDMQSFFAWTSVLLHLSFLDQVILLSDFYWYILQPSLLDTPSTQEGKQVKARFYKETNKRQVAVMLVRQNHTH